MPEVSCKLTIHAPEGSVPPDGGAIVQRISFLLLARPNCELPETAHPDRETLNVPVAAGWMGVIAGVGGSGGVSENCKRAAGDPYQTSKSKGVEILGGTMMGI